MHVFRRYLEARLFLRESRHEFTDSRIKFARHRKIACHRKVARTFGNSKGFQEFLVRAGVPAYVSVCCCEHVSIFNLGCYNAIYAEKANLAKAHC